MVEKQKELFERIVNTQYASFRLRGIVQNEFNEDNSIPSMEEVMEWCDRVQDSIDELVQIRYDVLNYLDELKDDGKLF